MGRIEKIANGWLIFLFLGAPAIDCWTIGVRWALNGFHP
jgi:hypothetical protein